MVAMNRLVFVTLQSRDVFSYSPSNASFWNYSSPAPLVKRTAPSAMKPGILKNKDHDILFKVVKLITVETTTRMASRVVDKI
jgi:hypothetical protein